MFVFDYFKKFMKKYFKQNNILTNFKNLATKNY